MGCVLDRSKSAFQKNETDLESIKDAASSDMMTKSNMQTPD